MELEELRAYLKDEEESDEVLLSLQKAAEEYLENAGIPPMYDKELYKLAIKLLVGNWSENRLPTVSGNQEAMEYSLKRIMLQMQTGSENW